MAIPPALDPRQLAAEIEASVAEFNRLAALAASMVVVAAAEVGTQEGVGEPPTWPIVRRLFGAGRAGVLVRQLCARGHRERP